MPKMAIGKLSYQNKKVKSLVKSIPLSIHHLEDISIFKRLLFEIKSSSEVFQRTVSQILENQEGCEVIVNDILVWKTKSKEHNGRLCEVLNRIRQSNKR